MSQSRIPRLIEGEHHHVVGGEFPFGGPYNKWDAMWHVCRNCGQVICFWGIPRLHIVERRVQRYL